MDAQIEQVAFSDAGRVRCVAARGAPGVRVRVMAVGVPLSSSVTVTVPAPALVRLNRLDVVPARGTTVYALLAVVDKAAAPTLASGR
jgi:hypothetical protein